MSLTPREPRTFPPPLPSAAARADAPVSAPPRRRRSAAGSALLGFMCGMVCWHFVGFWSFVREVVLRGPEPAAGEERAVANDGKARGQLAPTLPAAVAEACVALVRDGARGEVRALACHGTPLLRTNPSPRRGDLAVQILARTAAADEAWTTTISAD